MSNKKSKDINVPQCIEALEQMHEFFKQLHAQPECEAMTDAVAASPTNAGRFTCAAADVYRAIKTLIKCINMVQEQEELNQKTSDMLETLRCQLDILQRYLLKNAFIITGNVTMVRDPQAGDSKEGGQS